MSVSGTLKRFISMTRSHNAAFVISTTFTISSTPAKSACMADLRTQLTMLCGKKLSKKTQTRRGSYQLRFKQRPSSDIRSQPRPSASGRIRRSPTTSRRPNPTSSRTPRKAQGALPSFPSSFMTFSLSLARSLRRSSKPVFLTSPNTTP